MEKIIDQIYTTLSLDAPYLKIVIQLAIAIAIFIIGSLIAKIIYNIVRKSLEIKKVDEGLKPFLLSLTSTGLKLVVILIAASIMGFQLASLVAVFGALVFAIGMALQGSLAHFASGVLILIFKPYQVGDKVEIAGYTGKVKEVQVFNTILITSDSKTAIIPNGIVTKNAILNHSKEGIIRVDMVFGVGYDEDIDRVKAVIKSVADSCPEIIKEKEIVISVGELAADSVNFSVWPYCKTDDYWNVYFYMHENIKKQLDANNISIPYPQMDVHMINNEN